MNCKGPREICDSKPLKVRECLNPKCGAITCLRMCIAPTLAPTLTVIVSGDLEPDPRKPHPRSHCCQMTVHTFYKQRLIPAAERCGLRVQKLVVTCMDEWKKLMTKPLAPGAVAVFFHSSLRPGVWSDCVDISDYYPVLESLSRRHLLLYPGPPVVDRKHSEKRYLSALMPPTRLLSLRKVAAEDEDDDDEWRIEPSPEEATSAVISDAREKGLSCSRLMVKMGCSWGGQQVYPTEATAEKVGETVMKKMLPHVPDRLDDVCVMVQACISVVAELRFCVLDGKLLCYDWEGVQPGEAGAAVFNGDWEACMKTAEQSRQALKDAGLVNTHEDILRLEARGWEQAKLVLEETKKDFGFLPQYMRIDLMVTEDGRFFLGERESYGADLVTRGLLPNNSEEREEKMVAQAMVMRACEWMGLKHPFESGDYFRRLN